MISHWMTTKLSSVSVSIIIPGCLQDIPKASRPNSLLFGSFVIHYFACQVHYHLTLNKALYVIKIMMSDHPYVCISYTSSSHPTGHIGGAVIPEVVFCTYKYLLSLNAVKHLWNLLIHLIYRINKHRYLFYTEDPKSSRVMEFS